MSNTIEKEIKKLVSEKNFKKIESFFEGNTEYEKKSYFNKNFYFDTADNYFFNHNISIKVRNESKKFILFIKNELINSINTRECSEISFFISESDLNNFVLYNQMPDDLYDYLKKNMMPVTLQYKGYLLTQRTTFESKNYSLIICLDKNSYLEYNDYEVEIEYDSLSDLYNVPKILKEISGESESKYQRFTKKSFGGKQNNSIRIQTSGIILSDNQVLLIKKRNVNSTIRNKLIPPGGHVDYFESPYEAIVREIREETGLIVEKNELNLSSIVNFYNSNSSKQSICFFFKIHSYGKIKNQEFDINPTWINISDIKNNEDITLYHKHIIINAIFDKPISYFEINTESEEFTQHEM